MKHNLILYLNTVKQLIYFMERDDVITIIPIEKPKPIKLDWYSEIKQKQMVQKSKITIN